MLPLCVHSKHPAYHHLKNLLHCLPVFIIYAKPSKALGLQAAALSISKSLGKHVNTHYFSNKALFSTCSLLYNENESHQCGTWCALKIKTVPFAKEVLSSNSHEDITSRTGNRTSAEAQRYNWAAAGKHLPENSSCLKSKAKSCWSLLFPSNSSYQGNTSGL